MLGSTSNGLTNRQIADLLHVAERTAENHIQHILTKLGCQNRTQIAAWAMTQRPGDLRPRLTSPLDCARSMTQKDDIT